MNNNISYLFCNSYNFYFNCISKNLIKTNINDNKFNKYSNKIIKLCSFNNEFQFINKNNQYYNYLVNWLNINKNLLPKIINDIFFNNNNINNLSNNDKYFYKNIIFSLFFKILINQFNYTFDVYIDNDIFYILKL